MNTLITSDLRYCIFWWLNLVVCFCWGNHCWFIFVSWRGYCSVSFQSFVWRYLVITPIRDTKKLLNVLCLLQTDSDTSSCERNYIHYVQRAKKLHTLLTLISSSSYWNPYANASIAKIYFSKVYLLAFKPSPNSHTDLQTFPRWGSLSPRVSPSRAPVFSCAHYFQAPATQASWESLFKVKKNFPVGDHFTNFINYVSILLRENWYWSWLKGF